MSARAREHAPGLAEFLGDGPCHTCKLDHASWRYGRGRRFLVHDGGKRTCRFPCRTCEHLDCEQLRNETENK
jgi:hypothetical protein